MTASTELLAHLTNPAFYPHPVDKVEVRETHISWVFLAGDFAYKLKKPVDFGFLNYTSKEVRQKYCQLELELNQRLAPQLYLEVLPLTGSPSEPQINGEGEVFDYLLKMQRFDDSQLLANLEEKGKLKEEHLLQLIEDLAEFHLSLAPGEPPEIASKKLGSPEVVWPLLEQNFDQIKPFLTKAEDLAQLERIKVWTQDTFQRLQPLMQERVAMGFIRPCHGDLHLGNTTLHQGKVIAFDCIEFNLELRWLDTTSDLGFLIMDLESRGQASLAQLSLNHYLELTGDYQSLALLNLYKSFRALVRAKICLFNLSQPDLSETAKQDIFTNYYKYAALAESYTEFSTPYLLITHGFSGSGKSTLTKEVVKQLNGIRIRSDVERKRLYSFAPTAKTNHQQELDAGIYTPEATAKTYAELTRLANLVLRACYPVTLDATNLKLAQRQQLVEVAQSLGLASLIISMGASEDTLRRRIAKRLATAVENKEASEANLEVLEQQLANHDPLTEEELAYTVKVDTDAPNASQTLVELIKKQFHL